MQLDDSPGTSGLVQPVNILGDNRCQLARILLLCQGEVGRIGLGIVNQWASYIPKERPVVGRINREIINRGVLVGIVFHPESSRPPIGRDARFFRNPGTRESDDPALAYGLLQASDSIFHNIPFQSIMSQIHGSLMLLNDRPDSIAISQPFFKFFQ